MTLQELGQLFENHLQGLHRHPSTLTNHRLARRGFILFCHETLSLDDPRQLQQQHFIGYFQHLQNQPLTKLVQYSRQRMIKTWMAWATYQGLLLLDPCKDFTWKHPPQIPRGTPSENQVQQLLAAPDASLLGQRDRALLELLYGTGLRGGECSALDLGDVQLDQRQLFIRKGKGGRQRLLPLGVRLCEVLHRYISEVRPRFSGHETQALWISIRAQRLDVMCINLRVRRWAQKAGDLPITSHSLRHAFATHLLARGAPLIAIQRLLGHVTLNMTQRYTHVVPIDIRDALRNHHPRGRKDSRAQQ